MPRTDVSDVSGGEVLGRDAPAAFLAMRRAFAGLLFRRGAFLRFRLRSYGLIRRQLDEAQAVGADDDLVAGGEVGLRHDALLADQGAIGAVEIGDLALPADDFDLAVDARELAVVEPDVVAGVAADGESAVFGDRKSLTLSLARHHH